MKRRIVSMGIPILLAAATAGLVGGCAKQEQAQSPVERGRYLVMVAGCNDCHTPKVMTPAGPAFDTTRLLSGHPADAPLAEIPQGGLRSRQVDGSDQ